VLVLCRGAAMAKVTLNSWNKRKGLEAGRYGARVAAGLYLIYRRHVKGGAGVWFVRWQDDSGKFHQGQIGTADDGITADGTSVLNYDQACKAAEAWRSDKENELLRGGDRRGAQKPKTKKGARFTVADALEAYSKDAERRGVKGLRQDRRRAVTWILPELGGIEVKKLTKERIENWLDDIGEAPKLVRAHFGGTKPAKPPQTKDEKRARRDSANRVLTVLKAALTYCTDNDLAKSPSRPWTAVKPFRGTAKARVRFLTPTEAALLVNSIDNQDFKDLVRGALLTGCRYGELARLQVKDFDPRNGTIFIAESKSGKPRHIYLNGEGQSLFNELTIGKVHSDLIFTNGAERRKRGGSAWQNSDQTRLTKAACLRAGIEPIAFHELRHTFASMLVNAHVPLAYVAEQLGHADVRMVSKHYGHLAPSAMAAAVRAGLPVMGIVDVPKVERLNINQKMG